ncbi:MAG: hypothetical protein RIC55_35455 [Pirellulaceae bacterium]
MSGEPSSLRWWKLHWSAVAAWLLVALAFVYANLIGKSNEGRWLHGWPNLYLWRSADIEVLIPTDTWDSYYYEDSSRWPGDKARVIDFLPAMLAFNAGLALLLACGAGYTLQRWSASPRHPMQVNLKFLLALIGWVAGLLMLLGLNTATLAGWENWGYRAAVDVALAATGLTSYAVVDLVVVALGLASRRSQPPETS